MKLWIGLILLVVSGLSYLMEKQGIKLPTISWGYNFSRSAGELNIPLDWLTWLIEKAGHVTAVILALVGVWLVVSFLTDRTPNPITLRKIKRFKEIKRGYYSFLILLGLAGLVLGSVHLLIDTQRPVDWWVRYFKKSGQAPEAGMIAIWLDQVMHLACIALWVVLA